MQTTLGSQTLALEWPEIVDKRGTDQGLFQNKYVYIHLKEKYNPPTLDTEKKK